MLVVLWTLSYPLVKDFDTWQIVLSAGTSAITFLLVALLQNAQSRGERAAQCKLDAIAAGLAEVMRKLEENDSDLRPHLDALEAAVGLDKRVSGRDVLSGSSDLPAIPTDDEETGSDLTPSR